jgi:OOP family OmpA-OmpF porin
MIRLARLFLAALCATPAVAQELSSLPETATISVSTPEQSARTSLPIGPWQAETVERLTVEGKVTQTAWRIPKNTLTPLELIAPVRAELTAEGFTPLYECAADICGGFDFRYAMTLLPEPEMHVDLVDYQYLIAQNGNDIYAVIASKSTESGFIQTTRVQQAQRTTAPRESVLPTADMAPSSSTASLGSLADQLSRDGHAALDDLVFSSGAAALETRDYESLKALSDYLKANPNTRAALVGHTDATGALAGNIALSKRRAEAVRDRLIENWAVPNDQITAEGAGWLAPRATNDTQEGRDKNRRVEVVITSTPS